MAEEIDGVDRIARARLDKLERLEDAGLRGFPTTFGRSHRAQEVHAAYAELEGQRVSVAGRLDVFRKPSGNLVFADLKDESGKIQLMLHPRTMAEPMRLVYESLDPGDFVGACGTVVKSKSGEVSVEADELTLLSKSLRNPPEKWHGVVDVETRYRQRYLDLARFFLQVKNITALQHYEGHAGRAGYFAAGAADVAAMAPAAASKPNPPAAIRRAWSPSPGRRSSSTLRS